MISEDKLNLIKDYSKEKISIFYKELKKKKVQEFYILWKTTDIDFYPKHKNYIVSFDIEPKRITTMQCTFNYGNFNLSLPLQTFGKCLWTYQHKNIKSLIKECTRSYIKMKIKSRRHIEIIDFGF